MSTTTNLSLAKIDSSDYVNPEVFNSNYDILDALGVDYVTEQGTTTASGGETVEYRKWKSGIAEAWIEHTLSSVAITTAWGGIYENSGGIRYNYPTGLFISEPFVIASCQATQQGSGIAVIGAPEISGSGSSTQTPSYNFLRGSSGTVGVKIAIYAKGRWKS